MKNLLKPPCTFDKGESKAAGYHRHIFCPPVLLVMLFKRMKAFFFGKILLIKSSDFSKFKNFLIFRKKNLTIKVGRK